MKKFYILAFATLGLLFFTACSDNKTKKAQVIATEEKQVEQNDIKLTTIDGKEIELSFKDNVLTSKDLNGKIVLLNFWATWCPPCLEELPIFNKFYEQYGDVFEIIGVLYQDNISKANLLEFIKANNIKFPIAVGGANVEAAKLFDIKKIPESFLFSKDGYMFEKYTGLVDEKVLEKYLQENTK